MYKWNPDVLRDHVLDKYGAIVDAGSWTCTWNDWELEGAVSKMWTVITASTTTCVTADTGDWPALVNAAIRPRAYPEAGRWCLCVPLLNAPYDLPTGSLEPREVADILAFRNAQGEVLCVALRKSSLMMARARYIDNQVELGNSQRWNIDTNAVHALVALFRGLDPAG